MKGALRVGLGLLLVMGIGAASAHATIIYASSVVQLERGSAVVPGFPGFYGGTFPGAFPVALTPAEAQTAVLGAPDTDFLSLPGDEANHPTPSGTGFQWAFVTLDFGSLVFDGSSHLLITELGDSAESAYVFVWTNDGSNVQFTRTRGASDTIDVDLSPYGAFAAAHGGFTEVTIGGQDLLGASPGFDLDAVGVQVVPEPTTIVTLAWGLVGVAAARRRRA